MCCCAAALPQSTAKNAAIRVAVRADKKMWLVRFDMESSSIRVKTLSPSSVQRVAKQKRLKVCARSANLSTRKSRREKADEFQAASLARLLRFQNKYPGTPISTIAAPQKASFGLWMMVLSVHATPTSM